MLNQFAVFGFVQCEKNTPKTQILPFEMNSTKKIRMNKTKMSKTIKNYAVVKKKFKRNVSFQGNCEANYELQTVCEHNFVGKKGYYFMRKSFFLLFFLKSS